jgi:two-component system chemotaxis response regulator CheB
MGSSVRVLIAEDESKSFEILKRVLGRNNWIVDSALDGEQALTMFKESPYEVLLTDLNMPKMNGMELISRVRNEVTQKPLVVMFTAYKDAGIKARAQELEVDGFFTKPVDFKKLFECILNGLTRLKKEKKKGSSLSEIQTPKDLDLIQPPFIGVAIAVSTGGPQTLKILFDSLTLPFNASLFLVQHGPGWVLEALAESLNNEYEFPIQLATDGMKPQVDQIYLAPGDRHLGINPETFCLELSNDPPEHFLRPAADALFRSAARAFGKYCVGIVLSGLGKDGALGAKKICNFGGKVLIQDPKTALANTMPKMAIDSEIKHQVVPINQMAKTLLKNTLNMSQQLNGIKKKI